MLHCCDLRSQRNSNTDPSPQLHACRSKIFYKKQKCATTLADHKFSAKSKKINDALGDRV